jgi:zinc protease
MTRRLANRPSQYLPLVLWMEADRMATLRIDKATFENEREVVKEERRLRVDNPPFGRLSEILYDQFYTVSPYKHTTIGSMKDLDAASVEDVRDFHGQFYVPHNATMAIVGDFDMAQAKELVTRYFGRVPKSDRVIPRDYPREAPTKTERRITVNESWPLPAVIVAYPITWDGNPDSYPLHLTSKILSDGDSSRIYQSLVYEKQIALSAFGGRNIIEAEPVFRRGARGAWAFARRGRKGARRRVRQAAHAADIRARAAARQEPVLPRLHRRSRIGARQGEPAGPCRRHP